MATFTLPAYLRETARSHQKIFFNLLFKAAAEAIMTLAYLGGKIGIVGILHTRARNLSFHPHVHFVVTGGGLFEDENIWLPAKEDFLVPVKAMSKIFRAKFKETLKNMNERLFKKIPRTVWKTTGSFTRKP